MRIKVFLQIMMLMVLLTACNSADGQIKNNEFEILYTMPEEAELHEGTWLQWPHHYQYGMTYRNRLDQTWIDITKELVLSEKVHIVVYDVNEKKRVNELLNAAGVTLEDIDFKIYKTNDVWIRDNGPVFVRDKKGDLLIEDWGFNGWGEKVEYLNCDKIPSAIASDLNIEPIDLNTVMINEGGSIEVDGNGTLMACKSSILNNNRNPLVTQIMAENIFTKYLGVTHFIWLDGQAGLDVTDQHIDGFARFANSITIVTMEEDDLLYYDVKQSDIDILYAAKNKDGEPYTFIKLPLTQNNVVTTYGHNLGYKGSYCNFYIANTKVLIPIYDDPNDKVAIDKIQMLFPSKQVVGIDVRNLYAGGGMIHCVTQQQPQ